MSVTFKMVPKSDTYGVAEITPPVHRSPLPIRDQELLPREQLLMELLRAALWKQGLKNECRI